MTALERGPVALVLSEGAGQRRECPVLTGARLHETGLQLARACGLPARRVTDGQRRPTGLGARIRQPREALGAAG